LSAISWTASRHRSEFLPWFGPFAQLEWVGTAIRFERNAAMRAFRIYTGGVACRVDCEDRDHTKSDTGAANIGSNTGNKDNERNPEFVNPFPALIGR
jgi:hypothetical protein